MRDAIARAAEVLDAHQLGEARGGSANRSWCQCSCGSRLETGGTRDHAMTFGHRHIARALAEAGLLAPAPLREEWAQRWTRRSGEVRVMKVASEEDADPGREPGVEAIHRYRTDWWPIDGISRADGDGRAVSHE